MKKLIPLGCFILHFTLFILHSFTQAPQAFPYQAVAPDNNGNLLVNHALSLSFSIIDVDGSTTGTVVYSETQAAISCS